MFWNILEYFGIFWNILEYFGIFWNILKYFEIFWNILEFTLNLLWIYGQLCLLRSILQSTLQLQLAGTLDTYQIFFSIFINFSSISSTVRHFWYFSSYLRCSIEPFWHKKSCQTELDRCQCTFQSQWPSTYKSRLKPNPVFRCIFRIFLGLFCSNLNLFNRF